MRDIKSKIIISAIFALVASLSVWGIVSAFSDTEIIQPSQPHLNKLITNEMSEIPELEPMDRRIRKYMAQWGIHGASLCVMRNDSLLYAKGYGWADEENEEKMEPWHLMRVASVSKLITAAGIMMLKEQGRISLDSKVFGEEGILNDEMFLTPIKDKRYFNITIEDLLRHRAGFTSGAGDPMFSTITMMQRYHLKSAPDNNTLLSCCLSRPLGYTPGSRSAYSNIGYMILSLAIEKITGDSYEEWIKENVLRPAGCFDMHIAGNYLKDRRKNEVKYYVQSNDPMVPEYTGSGRMVVRCYGGNDISNLSGAGAWICSMPELARFVASIDAKDGVKCIISPESVLEMTKDTDESTYSLGWIDTNKAGIWTRTGTFSGTSALIKYYPNGECWILVTNTSTWKGPIQTKYTSSLFNTLRATWSRDLPQRDLFHPEEMKEGVEDEG